MINIERISECLFCTTCERCAPIVLAIEWGHVIQHDSRDNTRALLAKMLSAPSLRAAWDELGKPHVLQALLANVMVARGFMRVEVRPEPAFGPNAARVTWAPEPFFGFMRDNQSVHYTMVLSADSMVKAVKLLADLPVGAGVDSAVAAMRAAERVMGLAFEGHGLRVIISAEACKAMMNAAQDATPFETAGPLFGRYAKPTGDSSAPITTALAIEALVSVRSSGSWSCETDADAEQMMVEERWPASYFLGSWHTHPMESPEPSVEDARTLRATAESKEWNCPEPLMLIMGGTKQAPRWSIHVWFGGMMVRLLPCRDPVRWSAEEQALLGLGSWQ
jgi:integrative and conjugative element protein (TIGR02256 family)